jgi:pimeloyl-ACP methyl ester carboxylesterase
VTRPAQAEDILQVHPEIKYWAAGGHSLGGTAAASFADAHPQINALILYASYPATKLQRSDLKVLSIGGSADTLTTPYEIEASKADLPPSASYLIIPGAVHSDFGDYGRQPGDGTPTIDHLTAQSETQQVTVDFLASLTPPPKSKK